MYKEFYALTQDPFRLTPDPEFFFLGEYQKKSLANLLYGINERKGFIALTGEVGAGKTTLCRLLLKQLDSNVSVAIILNSLVDEITFLKQINRDFAIPYDTDSHDDLFGYLYDFLIEQKRKNRNVLVIVDECQNLKFEVLEQIRMLSNLETEKDKLLQILLIGQPEFIDMLNSYKLRQLNQRITVKTHISALNIKEMEAYIYHRLKVAGNENAVKFTSDAIKKIFKFSEGIPRKINVVCEYALLSGYVENASIITAKIVKKGLKDIEIKRENKDLNPEEYKRKVILPVRRVLIAALVLLCLFFWKDSIKSGFDKYGDTIKPVFKAYALESINSIKTMVATKNETVKLPVDKNIEIKKEAPAAVITTKIEEKADNKKEIKKEVKKEVIPVVIKEEAKKEIVAETVIKKEEPAKPEIQTPIQASVALPQEVTQPVSDVNKEEKIETGIEPLSVSVVKETRPPEIVKEEIKPELTDLQKMSSKASTDYFNELNDREKGIWLLLSTWGVEISHHRKNENGEIIPLESQIDRFNFNIFSTWADFSLIKLINLPCAVEVLNNGKNCYWVLNGIKENKIRIFKSPGKYEVMDESAFMKIWQGNSIVLSEKGEYTLEGENVIYKGMEGHDIIRLKKILSVMNFFSGDMTNTVFDLDLENAVKSFQKNFCLTEDGIVGCEAKLLFYSLLSRNIPRLIATISRS